MARLPVLGAYLAGLELTGYEEALPRLGRVTHAGVSWPLWCAGLLAFGVVLGALARPLLRATEPPRAATAPFPWWGYAGLGLVAVSWSVAWSEAPPVAPSRPYTFTPLWVGFVVITNALARRCSGASFWSRPGALAVTAISAVFWWFFEYLNRFVESWDYQGVEVQSLADLLVFVLMPFATVLPAVMSVQDLIASSPRVAGGFRGPPVTVRWGRLLGGGGALASAAGLVLLPIFPNVLFPLLWLAPLLILTGLAAARGERHIFSELAEGDYRLVASAALAGLVTGLFWELWNWRSLARWTYSVPYVGVARVFEMPLLGYAGYLTFGLECVVVAELAGFDARWRLRRDDEGTRLRRAP